MTGMTPQEAAEAAAEAAQAAQIAAEKAQALADHARLMAGDGGSGLDAVFLQVLAFALVALLAAGVGAVVASHRGARQVAPLMLAGAGVACLARGGGRAVLAIGGGHGQLMDVVKGETGGHGHRCLVRSLRARPGRCCWRAMTGSVRASAAAGEQHDPRGGSRADRFAGHDAAGVRSAGGVAGAVRACRRGCCGPAGAAGR